jgi:hypothetical protein
VAIDVASRERVLQGPGRELLEGLCWRLGLMVVERGKELPQRPAKSKWPATEPRRRPVTPHRR